MKSSKENIMAFFIAGSIHKKTGEITGLNFPEPTAEFKECCLYTAKDKWVRELKHDIDTTNAVRPPGFDPRDLSRDDQPPSQPDGFANLRLLELDCDGIAEREGLPCLRSRLLALTS